MGAFIKAALTLVAALGNVDASTPSAEECTELLLQGFQERYAALMRGSRRGNRHMGFAYKAPLVHKEMPSECHKEIIQSCFLPTLKVHLDTAIFVTATLLSNICRGTFLSEQMLPRREKYGQKCCCAEFF